MSKQFNIIILEIAIISFFKDFIREKYMDFEEIFLIGLPSDYFNLVSWVEFQFGYVSCVMNLVPSKM